MIAVPTAPEDTANGQRRRSEEEHSEVIDLDAELPQGSLEVQAEFDKLVVWGHETTVDGAADPYVRAVGEWIALAEKVRFVSFRDGEFRQGDANFEVTDTLLRGVFIRGEQEVRFLLCRLRT